MSIKVKDILSFLDSRNIGYKTYQNINQNIEGFSSLENYKKNTIAWCRDESYIPLGVNIEEIALLITDKIDLKGNNILLVSEEPRKVYFEIVDKFFTKVRYKRNIGLGTTIEGNVRIAKNVRIGSNCVLDGDISIGENTTIGNNVVIVNNVKIGSNCNIQSLTVIGEDGFSYSEDENHNKTMIKHYGSVEIEDNVNIGSNCSIARGTIDATVIRKGSKIDNLCHIAHNVEIGENTTLIAGSIIYGSVKLGKNNYVASGIVRNQCKLGDNVTVGMGSVVVKNIGANKTVKGIPAK